MVPTILKLRHILALMSLQGITTLAKRRVYKCNIALIIMQLCTCSTKLYMIIQMSDI